ncbi:hypothetical protein LUZ60_001213 [Juncus effusus]|nr:hypothetical protein LUZ60_001213 [Juncus effusus]
MGRSESEWNKCKKHPKHKSSSGVCPYCLRERLSQLTSPSFSSLLTMACSSSDSSTPYYSSDSDLSSLPESPHEKRQRDRLTFLLKDEIQLGQEWPERKSELLMKSRSLIHVVVRKNDSDEEKKEVTMTKGKEVMETTDKKEKKGKFWSKFMKGGLRKDQGEKKEKSLGYSRTLKEKPSAKWVPF